MTRTLIENYDFSKGEELRMMYLKNDVLIQIDIFQTNLKTIKSANFFRCFFMVQPPKKPALKTLE